MTVPPPTYCGHVWSPACAAVPLTIGLGAAAPHLAAALGGMSALTCCCQLSRDHLMDQRDIRGHVEELSWQIGGTGLGALDIEHIDRTGFAVPGSFLAALRRTAKPPLLPGIAPLIKIRPRSASTACTVRFCTVTRSTPIRPAIRRPLKTRPGVAQPPIDPGERCLRCTTGCAAASEPMLLHDTGSAFALADTGHVDDVTIGESGQR